MTLDAKKTIWKSERFLKEQNKCDADGDDDMYGMGWDRRDGMG